jgi:hypothetical protein
VELPETRASCLARTFCSCSFNPIAQETNFGHQREIENQFKFLIYKIIYKLK